MVSYTVRRGDTLGGIARRFYGDAGRYPLIVAANRIPDAGLAILVSQGLRTWEEQDALYAKGRTIPPLGPEYFVTRARGGQSYHNFGLAFDIVVIDAVTKAGWDDRHHGWGIAGALGKSVGLEWGGDGPDSRTCRTTSTRVGCRCRSAAV